MNKKYTSYVMLGVLAMSVLLLSASPIMAGTLTINTNPSGATATLGGKSLGATPVTIDSATILSTTSLILTKSGYVSKNTAVYPGMAGSFTYNLNPSSTTTTYSAPAPTPAPTPASTPAPTPAPAPAPTGGMTIDSKPSGADVYYLYGANDGKYMGRTPFIYDPSIGFTYIKFVKPGYQNSIGRVYPAMAEKNNLYVANLYPI